MAKRSKRRVSRRERDQAGCISGIMNMFNFRQARTTKRLLSDRKQTSDQTAVGEHSSDNIISPSPTEICERSGDTEESKMAITDANKTSVKELMEEDMFNEKGSKQTNKSEMATTKSGNLSKKMHQKKKRSSAKSSDMDFDLANEQIKLGNNLDLDRILEELDNISKRLTTNCSNHSLDFDADEEKLVQAVKLSIEQKMSSDHNCYSEEMIMDALQTLSLNKGLVLKLLQDPNSKLFQHVQDSEEVRLGKEEPVNLKADKLSRHNNKNPVGENNKGCQSQSKIVILMPGPEESRSPETDILGSNNNNTKVHLNEKSVYHFSFSGIKRKLKHVMGKDRPAHIYPPKTQNSNFTSEKSESFGWRSPNRNHFYTERFTLPSFKKGEVVGKLKVDSERPNIYIEAKKHLSEMVKSGDENAMSTYRNSPVKVKPLGRILSLPDYVGSPCPSPRKPGDDTFMRLSPRGTVKADPIQRVQNSDSQPCTSSSESEDKVQSLDVNDNLLGDDKKYSSEIECFNDDTIVSEVQSEAVEIEQTNELRSLEEANIIGGETIKIDHEENASMDSILHLPGEDQVLLSPAVSPPQDRENTEIEIEDSNHAVDKIEQPSPISVLEPLLTDDDISPPSASTISQPVKNEVQPRHIHFEEERQSSIQDQGICTRISMEDEETAFEYVEAVLLGSDLNWDEFLLRFVRASEILDQSLFEEVELFSSRPLHDQKLLFDSANEALKEVCECYFGCFGIKNKANSVPKGMDLINAVWGRVECCLSQHLQSRSLDKLIRDDLVESKKWMNVRLDMEGIVFDMEESIFGELVEEIVVSFGDVEL